MTLKVRVEKATALIIILLLLFMVFSVSLFTVPLIVKGDPPFSSNKKVNIDNASIQWKPSIAVDSAGTIYVAWEDERNDDADIFFAQSTDGGTTWTDPNVMVSSDTTNADQRKPAIAVDSFGTIYVAWQDDRNGNWDIYFANSTDGGVTWTDPDVIVSNDTKNASQRNPAIAVDSSGNVYVVWQDNRNGNADIFFANSTDGGETWTDPNVRVNDADTVNQYEPTIAVDSSGTIYLAWGDYRNGDWDIYISNSTDGGHTWKKPNIRASYDTTNTSQINPTIAVDSSGIVYLAWEDYRNGNADIFSAKSTDGGITWTNPNVQVDTQADMESQYYPSLAVDSFGTVYVAWQDFRYLTHYDVFFTKSIDGGTTWAYSDVRVNDDDDASQRYPVLTASSGGTVYVVWEDMRNGNFDVYFAGSTPNPFADLLSVEGFLGSTPEIQHIIPNEPELSFRYNDPKSDLVARYNVSVWDAEGTILLWYCNKTDSVPSGSEITVTYNTAPFPTNGAPLLDGVTYKFRVQVENISGMWGPISEVDFHMNEVLTPIIPVSPADDSLIEASANQTVNWASPVTDAEGDSPVSYSWEVSTSPDFTNIIESGFGLANESGPFNTIPSGNFFWRVNLTDGWETSAYGNKTYGYWNFTTYTPPNNLPTITNEALAPNTATVGSELTFTFTATDADSDPLSWSKISGPEWLSIGQDNGTIYGTPSSDDVGLNNFTIQVNDGKGGADNFTFTITVESDGDGDGQEPDDDDDQADNSFLWLILIIIIVIIIFVVLVLLIRRKKTSE